MEDTKSNEAQPSNDVQPSGGTERTVSSYQQDFSLRSNFPRILQHQSSRDAEATMRKTRFFYAGLCVVLLCFYLVAFRSIPIQHSVRDSEEGAGVDSMVSMENSKLKGTSDFNPKGLLNERACNDGGYSKRTLKRAFELPFASLFKDTKGEKKWEASSVILVDGYAYSICDNSWAISRFNDNLVPFEAGNKQIGDPGREAEDSGYEALFHDNGTFYILRESVLHEGKSYHAIIEELELGEDDYSVQASCSSEFAFEGNSKGFEGVITIRDTNNELVVLGLCEGNHCSEARKNDVGHGMFVAMKKTVSDDGSCLWSTIRKVKIPRSANFRDYSDAAIDENGRVAISSQEESAIWIGNLVGRDEVTGLWDLDKLQFDRSVGSVFSFPKNDDCDTIYCNIEGIEWINNEMLMAVSDKMKSRGKQDYRCFDKDQSVHVFVLP